jgi:hypothetical protein
MRKIQSPYPQQDIPGCKSAWLRALKYALPLTFFLLALFYYWFAVADRFVVFLYGHLGATAFDSRTSSRYWMSGLVANGGVLVANIAFHWVRGRWAAVQGNVYRPPTWWRIWLLSVIPLTAGILVITTSCNRPTLPLNLALACALVAVLGLALALIPASLAAANPTELLWLTPAGGGVTFLLLLLRVVELPAQGLVTRRQAYSILAVGGTLALTTTTLTTYLHARHRRIAWRVHQLLLAGAAIAYLFFPLVHHLLLTPPEYRYISSATNFFAHHPLIQLTSVLLIVGFVALLIKVQSKWLIQSTPTEVQHEEPIEESEYIDQ